MKWDGGELSGVQYGCVLGMDEKVGVCIEGVRSRFKPWGGVGGVRVGGWDGSGWHGGRHDLPQDESKCVRAGSEFDLSCLPEKCCGTRCRVPRLHWGQDRLSADFCGLVSSAPMSGGVAWRWLLHRARVWRRLRLASRPKWRILTKPAGRI